MSLVAYGAQDVYLTGNPQITLFKVVYRRHTNFSMECIELPLDTAKPGQRVTTPVIRNADLVSRAYLRTTLGDLTPSNASFNGSVAWVRRLGHAIIDNIEVQIGGSLIDRQYGVWMDIWYELTHHYDQERGYNQMIGDVPSLTTLTPVNENSTGVAGGAVLFTPLQFWFCRNYGLALPLIALQYHEVRVNIEYTPVSNLVVYTVGSNGVQPKFNGLSFGSCGLLIDYIYLDSEERRRFAQVGHEYLIEQVQDNEQNLQPGSTTQQFTLSFNHPCKEMIWAHRCGAFSGVNDNTFLCYTNSDSDDAWEYAVQEAASNLAASMFVRDGHDAPVGVTTASFTTDNEVPLFSIDSSTTGFSQLGNTVLRCTLVNAPSSQVTLEVIPNPVVIGSTNLASLLGVVSVDLYYDGLTLSRVEVSVTDHSLSLYDLSIPVQQFKQDNRVNGSNADDVAVVQVNNYGLCLDGSGNMVTSGKIILNGHDRFDEREGAYFNYVQPFQHHTRTPADGINVYSFGLHPEQHQPTGTTNMSRIDNCRLHYKIADVFAGLRHDVFNFYAGTQVYIYVTNYNVLRIMSGMGGLAYSN